LNRLVGSIAAVALAAACTSPRAPEIAKGGIALPFIENDYAQAVTKARERNVPVFVEVWAPW
jgi:hypothetical protein